MKKCFIAVFDLLGYKDFTLYNDNDHLIFRTGHLYRDAEISLGMGNYHNADGGYILADISKSRLNCFSFADTVVFWTNDCSFESLEELIAVCYEFNWRQVCFNFPARGAIVCGEVRFIYGHKENAVGGAYNVSNLYGKGYVSAHIKADSQSWSGCVIDSTVVDELRNFIDPPSFLEKYAIKYQVPYKKPVNDQTPEFAFRLVSTPLNSEAFENKKAGIIRCFEQDNKQMDDSVRLKLDNTIKFLEAHQE